MADILGYQLIKKSQTVRYKTNIQDSKVSALEVINRLKHTLIVRNTMVKSKIFLAVLWRKTYIKYAPEAFFENPDGVYSYNTFALVPYLIKAIQELNQKIKKLEKTA